MSVDDGATGRGRRRSHHACLNCRRKKTRCPGERPACSSCSRLGQQCSYAPVVRPAQNARSEERLQHLEEKLDLLLNGSVANRFQQQQQQQQQPPPHQQHQHQHPQQQSSQHENAIESSEKSQSPGSSSADQMASLSHPSVSLFENDDSSLRPSQADVAVGVGLYFKYCHRQPIWCFEREEVSDHSAIPEELACSILALTCRFHEKRNQLQLYRESAKTLIMLRIANGTVELTTIESLCLLSYSSFIDGNFQLGQFHLGLAFQLCRTAMLDVESMYMDRSPATERKKKLFWSLQLLEQFYGKQEGLLSISTDIWRPHYSSPGNARPESRPRGPPLPMDDLGCSDPSEPGIWNTSVHLGWVWSQVRKYVSNCARQVLTEPWRHDSMYAQVLSDFMETENRIPICHRYDSAKFYKRKITELKNNRDYWAPWLKEQFTYHAIHTVLNHPFLYIVGAQHNPNLAIPNTFWRRSSELALLHATWIVRMIDMVVDKQVPLADPFFGHIAAVAATVHLYYCCATAPRLKHKSNTDFNKCRRFLKRFIPSSTACELLDQNLDRMTRMAAGPEIMDVEDWMPSKIYLNVPLMWDILQFNSMEDPMQNSVTGLLDNSLIPSIATQGMNDNSSTLEIVVATSPEISINTADGGQEAPTLSFRSAAGPMMRDSPWSNSNDNSNNNTNNTNNNNNNNNNNQCRDEETLTFNFTPWLYADSNQLFNNGDFGYDSHSSTNGDDRGGPWWEGENMTGVLFNSF